MSALLFRLGLKQRNGVRPMQPFKRVDGALHRGIVYKMKLTPRRDAVDLSERPKRERELFLGDILGVAKRDAAPRLAFLGAQYNVKRASRADENDAKVRASNVSVGYVGSQWRQAAPGLVVCHSPKLTCRRRYGCLKKNSNM